MPRSKSLAALSRRCSSCSKSRSTPFGLPMTKNYHEEPNLSLYYAILSRCQLSPDDDIVLNRVITGKLFQKNPMGSVRINNAFLDEIELIRLVEPNSRPNVPCRHMVANSGKGGMRPFATAAFKTDVIPFPIIRK